MRRAAALLLAAAVLALAPAAHAADAPARALEASARASVLFSTMDVQPAFDPAFADSRSAASGVGTTSLQSVLWPSFLVDAFFFLYGFQSVERIGLGIAEARWPQGPSTADATQSDLLFANGGDPNAVPGKAGRAQATASEGEAHGDVVAVRATLAGGVILGSARSSSEVRTAEGTARAHALQALEGVKAGPLSIDAIEGEAFAMASVAEVSASARTVVTGVEVAGIRVVIDDEGVRAATDALQEQVDAVLSRSGIAVHLVPSARSTDDTSASASGGGVLVRVDQRTTDPSGTPRNATIEYLLGSASVSARSSPVAPLETDVLGEGFTRVPGITRTVVLPALGQEPAEPPRAPQGTHIRRRLVVVAAPAGIAASARGVYGAAILLGLLLLLVRPLVRAAARP